MREERMVGTESKCRTHTVEENMALWKEMLAGSERGQECAARFKFDMVTAHRGPGMSGVPQPSGTRRFPPHPCPLQP
jgi:glutamyl/glutaminyl-tRNA synthetase